MIIKFKAEGEFNTFRFIAGAAAIAGFAFLHNRLTRNERDTEELMAKVTVQQDDIDRLNTSVDTLTEGVRRGVVKLQELQTALEQMQANTPPEVDLDPLIDKANAAAHELSSALPENQPEPTPVDPEGGEPEAEPEPSEEEPPAEPVTEEDEE